MTAASKPCWCEVVNGRRHLANGCPKHDPRETPSAATTDESKRAANMMLLNSLVGLWERMPYMRFGQLVMNLSRTEDGFADTWEWSNSTWHERIREASRTWAK